MANKFLIGKLRKEDEGHAFEVPNKYAGGEVPNYYFILPIFIAIVLFYFMIKNAIN